MELDYAFLAERAGRLHDGKLIVFGGDIDYLETTGLPIPLQLALVVRLTLRPDEKLEGHTFGIAVSKPDGKREGVCSNVPINTRRHPFDPKSPSGARLIFDIHMLIDAPGPRSIHIIVDGQEIKTVRFVVILSPTGEGNENESNAKVVHGDKH
jgi:hypothetical protein